MTIARLCGWWTVWMWTIELSTKFSRRFYDIRRRPLFCMFSHKRDIFYTSAENSTLGSLRNFRKNSLTPQVNIEERRRRHLPCLLLEVSPNTAAAPRSTCGLLWCCDNPARTCTSTCHLMSSSHMTPLLHTTPSVNLGFIVYIESRY